jgi:hypothetical protein
METLSTGVNARGWRRMPSVELEDLVLAIRRQAEHQHLSPSTWDMVDRMRARAAELRRAGQ